MEELASVAFPAVVHLRWLGDWVRIGTLRSLCPRPGALPSLLLAIHKRDAGLHERQEVRPVEPPPSGLRHVEELVGHQEPLCAGTRALRYALTEPRTSSTCRKR